VQLARRGSAPNQESEEAVRGLDEWISRGHERQDDPPEIEPEEQAFLDHVDQQIERELSQAEAETELAGMFVRMLDKIRQREDEAKGQWLQGRGR